MEKLKKEYAEALERQNKFAADWRAHSEEVTILNKKIREKEKELLIKILTPLTGKYYKIKEEDSIKFLKFLKPSIGSMQKLRFKQIEIYLNRTRPLFRISEGINDAAIWNQKSLDNFMKNKIEISKKEFDEISAKLKNIKRYIK